MKVLGIIPARGGSKGIPHKNRKLLGGKPLMAYTIEAAKQATGLDDLIFSSEESKLMEIAEEMGVEVPFRRPASLATDQAGSLGVVQHALKFLAEHDRSYDAVCLLQVTNPFRRAEHIDAAVNAFAKAGTDALITVLKVPHEYNPHWVFATDERGHLKIATGEKQIIKRRQELPDAFVRDGSIYITRTEVIMQRNSLYGKTLAYLESDPERHVNIDTMADWEKAENLLAMQKNR